MKNIKLKLIICFCLLFAILSISTLAQQPKAATTEQINVIKLLEIANGDKEGNMNFDSNVSRVEFIKMAISASPSKDMAANTKLNVSLFPDVKNSYWGASYISVAINNGLVTGYMDGTFKPKNNVTLEEAVTIVLRLLGYSDSDFIGSYPSAQLQKYEDLKLDKNIEAVRGEYLTREECMILLYNALNAKTKSGAVYCTTLGYKTNSDGELDYSALLEDELDGPITVEDTQNIFTLADFVENNETSYVLNSSASSKENIKAGDVVYYSDVINTVFTYRKTATGIVNNSTSSTVTVGSKTYNLATATAQSKLALGGEFSEKKSFVTLILGINDGVVDIHPGSIDRIEENDDNDSRISMIDATISKAIFIKDDEMAESWTSSIPFPTENADIYLNGSKTQSPYILRNDCIYYSKQFNTIWIYRKTVSGAIETITPRNAPTSITVSGKTYSVATSNAQYDLSTYGMYDVGDRVSVILGINDECVAVLDAIKTNTFYYGVITDTGEKFFTDKDGESYEADYITVTDSTATSYTYEYENDKFSINDVVKVAVGEKVAISRHDNSIGKAAAATLSNAIKNGLFAEDCEIIDVKDNDVIKIKPSRISGAAIDVEMFTYSTIALYWEFDENGNFTKLILKNFTGDIDEYGVVLSSTRGKIKYMIDKNERQISTEGQGCSAGPARLIIASGNISSASSLTGVLEDIEAITDSSVYDKNGNEYAMSDDVKVFIKTVTGYEYVSISDVISSEYKLTAYYDKLPIYGGRVRVVIATKKI